MAYASEDNAPDSTPLPSAGDVQTEIADWKRRVGDLYCTIAQWLPKGEGYEVDTTTSLPVSEPMLSLHGLPSYSMPLLQIRRNGERCLFFLPDARWVMFTRGRVMIVVENGRGGRLLAKEAGSDGPEWSFYTSDNWQKGGDPWNEALLRSLLGVRQ